MDYGRPWRPTYPRVTWADFRSTRADSTRSLPAATSQSVDVKKHQFLSTWKRNRLVWASIVCDVLRFEAREICSSALFSTTGFNFEPHVR